VAGHAIGADAALRIGLVDAVVPTDELRAACMELAATLAQRPAFAVEAVKFLVDRSSEVDLSTGIALETYVARKMATAEQRRAAQHEASQRDATYGRLFGPGT
jgi:enoyl-CoA hydratase/carnithine racemase